MEHIPPISPFGQPIYGPSFNHGHPYDLQNGLNTLALTLTNGAYKNDQGTFDLDKLGGMVDVMLFLDTKLDDSSFHEGVTTLCQHFEAFKETNSTHLLGEMQSTIKNLGQQHTAIPQNLFVNLAVNLLEHIKEELMMYE